MKRFLLLFPLPAAVLVAWAVAPLVTGAETLFLRDVFNTHLPMKWVASEALRHGSLPLVDAFRGGGQPLLGNPNTVSLYPDNLLYLVAPFFWAFNAHFWLHLLLAAPAAYWLGRAWGLGRGEAWVVGATYAGSGFFLSTLNLYNLVAGAALAPAFVAAVLDLGSGRRQRVSLVAVGLLWALLLLAGDPLFAALSLALAVAALLLAGRPAVGRGRRLAGGVLALGIGCGVALPQIVEFLRILPLSFRGYWGFSPESATAASWNPASALEWLLPFAFGSPDLTFWGHAVYGGQPPLLYSVFPGVLALGLALAAGLPRERPARWAWVLVMVGLFVALGRHNPLMAPLLALPGASLLRFPVKMWLAVALGGALLCGLGARRSLDHGGRPLRRATAALAIVYLGLWLWLSFAPGAAESLRRIVPGRLPDAFVEGVRLRWAGLCLLALGLLAVAAAVSWRWRRGRAAGGAPVSAGLALLAALHLASQLFLLRPLLASDELAPYLEPPAALASVPPEARVVHASVFNLFGPVPLPVERFPDVRLRWLQRQTHEEMQPPAGVRWGRRYDLNLSPEGLHSFFTRAAAQALRELPDADRLKVLAATGVDHLLLSRPLDDDALGMVEEVATYPDIGGGLWVYRLPGAPPEVTLVGGIRRVPHLTAALAAVLDPSFDPRRTVVLPAREGQAGDRATEGSRAPDPVAVGRVELRVSAPERLAMDVSAASAGAVVVQRAWLSLWRAHLDGAPVPIRVANLDRMAVEVPAGSHRLELTVDRRPLAVTFPVALLCLLGLPLAAAWLGPRPTLSFRGSTGSSGAASSGPKIAGEPSSEPDDP